MPAMKSIIHSVLRVLCLVVSVASTAVATDSQSTQAELGSKSTWTVDDVLSEEGAFGFNISPDCRWVCWEKGGNLFQSSLTEKKERFFAVFSGIPSHVGKAATGFANPNGIEAFSPGLRATSYPG